jgi:hypothetical protein
MADANKRNLLYFKASSMRGLAGQGYDLGERWRSEGLEPQP